MVNVPEGAPRTMPAALKFAVTLLFPSIVTVTGLLVPLASPLQFEKR